MINILQVHIVEYLLLAVVPSILPIEVIQPHPPQPAHLVLGWRLFLRLVFLACGVLVVRRDELVELGGLSILPAGGWGEVGGQHEATGHEVHQH